MNFYDLIAKYKFLCNKKLDSNRINKNEITRELNEAKLYLDYLNSKRHISPFIAGCAGMAMLFVAMITSLFNTLLWVGLLAGGITFAGIGYFQEKKQEEFSRHKQEWYKHYSRLNSDLNQLRIEEQALKAMIYDVTTCCNYYMYLLEEQQKEIPITLDLNEVFDSNCLLSTYLDKFYTGDLDNFRKLSNWDKKYQERTSTIHRRIKEAKQSNGEIIESQPRRRRAQRFHEQQVEVPLSYPTYQRRAR